MTLYHPFDSARSDSWRMNAGFIEYNGGLKINTSLLSIVLHD
jgi:hypothetical protein